MRNFSAILAAATFACVFAAPARADFPGTWGDNTYGQLGDGNPGFLNFRTALYTIPSLDLNVTAAAAGGNHSLALKAGAVYSWGFNADGELGNGTTTDQSTPIPITTNLSSGVTAIAAGGFHNLAIKGGAVYAWGYNFYGEVGNASNTNQLTPVALSVVNSSVSAIAAGNTHSLAVKGGAVYAWGDNGNGQLGDASTTQRTSPVPAAVLTSGVTDVAAGASHSLAIQAGAVFSWGYNLNGELGDGTVTQRTSPVAISSLSTGVTDIAAGGFHSLAVKNGQVYAWGDNTFGQLGDNGVLLNSLTPILVPGPANIVQVAASFSSSYALSSDGSLWVWGDNTYGQLGLGDSFNLIYKTPTHLFPPAGLLYSSIDSDANGYHVAVTLVPEPASLALLALSSCGILLRRKSSRTQSA